MRSKNLLWKLITALFCVITLWTPLPARGQEGDQEDRLRVILGDEQGEPLPDVLVRLRLYPAGLQQDEGIPAGRCRTDQQGRCSILLRGQEDTRDPSGFYRGYLEVGDYGRRSLLWPGGRLDVHVWLDPSGGLYRATESEPYEWQSVDPDAAEADASTRPPLAKIVLVALILGGWLALVVWKGNP